VLGPEQREHGELEVVRVAIEEAANTVELTVAQPETAVERFRDEAQGSSVTRAPDGSRGPSVRTGRWPPAARSSCSQRSR
jgi:hypothetical protein